MSHPDLRTDFKYRGKIVHALPGGDSWEFESDAGRIDWRAILVAPKLSTVPIVLADIDDVDSLAGQRDEPGNVPDDDLRSELRAVFAEGASEGSAAQADRDRELIEEHRKLFDDYTDLYNRLPESERDLGPHSDILYMRAVEAGLLRSLTLIDQRPPQKLPFPVKPPYLPNVPAAAPAGFEATACQWNGLSVLFDRAYPRLPNGGLRPGTRCLVLFGNNYRTDLFSLDPKVLTLAAPPPPPPLPPAPPFRVRAATTT